MFAAGHGSDVAAGTESGASGLDFPSFPAPPGQASQSESANVEPVTLSLLGRDGVSPSLITSGVWRVEGPTGGINHRDRKELCKHRTEPILNLSLYLGRSGC